MQYNKLQYSLRFPNIKLRKFLNFPKPWNTYFNIMNESFCRWGFYLIIEGGNEQIGVRLVRMCNKCISRESAYKVRIILSRIPRKFSDSESKLSLLVNLSFGREEGITIDLVCSTILVYFRWRLGLSFIPTNNHLQDL